MKPHADLVVAIFARHLRNRETLQRDIARAVGCDPSRIAHILAGRQALPAGEVETWCDVVGTIEPYEAQLDRLGYAPPARRERDAAPCTIERGGYELLGAVSRVGEAISDALSDGRLDTPERERIRRHLKTTQDLVTNLLAKVPAQPVSLRGAS